MSHLYHQNIKKQRAFFFWGEKLETIREPEKLVKLRVDAGNQKAAVLRENKVKDQRRTTEKAARQQWTEKGTKTLRNQGIWIKGAEEHRQAFGAQYLWFPMGR